MHFENKKALILLMTRKNRFVLNSENKLHTDGCNAVKSELCAVVVHNTYLDG